MPPLVPGTGTTGDLDPFFVFDFVPVDDPADAGPRAPSRRGDGSTRDHADTDSPGPRLTTYWQVERGCRGPQPLPDWVVTDAGAVDTDLGVLKTGKEADVHLLDRTAPDGTGAVMAAKRYRSPEHRSFHRSSAYTEGRRVRRSRDTRALQRRTGYGRRLAAAEWAHAEWRALRTCWEVGVPVPYPVQLDGTEILMEFVGEGRAAAPRLAGLRPAPDLLEHYYEQVRAVVLTLAAQHLAHGDLSPYNLLADGDRLVAIDLPQVVDLVGNPAGPEFLRRDCRTMASWFRARGREVDPDALVEEALGYVGW